MFKLLLTAVLLTLSAPLTQAKSPTLHTFRRVQLTDQFWAEGVSFADFNRDGRMDIVAGPFWYEGPAFKTRHEYCPANQTFTRKKPDGTEQTVPGFEGALGANNAYSDNFCAFTCDFNRDNWPDILVIGIPGKDASWYENPKGRQGHWQRHVAFSVVDNESPTFGDLTGDGKPELICHTDGFLGYAEPDWSNPTAPWRFHAISPKGAWHKYSHGLGYGDVNGDGRMDFLEKDGWWEQPPSLANDPVWVKHPFNFGDGGVQMYAYDVNGDGLNDVITSLSAHGYGLAWFEQTKGQGAPAFRKHIIMNKEPGDNRYGVKFSQPHAIDLIDIDGDGLKDIVTGKRFWAHGPQGDAEPNAPAVLYWFKLVRVGGGQVDFIPYLIDDDSGVGTQVVARNILNKKFPDIIVSNKKGTFLFAHQTQTVSKAAWEKAQPKPLAQTGAAQEQSRPAQ